MGLPWEDDTGLRPNDVFTNCQVPHNMIGCIGYATNRINEDLTSSLVTSDVLSEGIADCQDYIFGKDLNQEISTMMTNVNQVCVLLDLP